MDPYLIAILVIAAYLFLIYALKRTGFLERHNMSLFGPILMWRTQKGKEFIERLSRPRRLWTAYASIAKAMCVIVMILIMALLLWVATVVANIPPERAPGPEMLLGIPGINPIIPIWYGILGLIVAVVVHELAHGIMTRVGGMPLKSLGLVFMVIPLGAFVEPEESELVKTDKRRRTSVYAAGPAANVILAIVCALLFSSAFLVSVEPVRENPVVVSTIGDGPGAHAGIGFGAQIVRIDGHEILFRDDFENFSAPAPGANVTVEYYYAGELLGKEVVSGVTVTQTASGLPAAEAGIKPGMIIASVNDTIIRNDTDFKRAMALTLPYQKVNITLLAYMEATDGFESFDDIANITLGSRKDYFLEVAPELVGPDFKDIGYLGVNTAYLGTSVNSPETILRRMAHPFYGVDDLNSLASSSLSYLSLPFLGLAPIQSPVTDLFTPSGALAWLPADLFWTLANSFYWIFWINIMVGMTNVLPAVPLDGGYLFKDWLDSLFRRVKRDSTEKEREKYVVTITYALALFVLTLIAWQIIGPRLL